VPQPESSKPGPPKAGGPFLILVPIALTVVAILQNTRYAPLTAQNAVPLWEAAIAAIAAVYVLRSGWGRDQAWQSEQRALGTDDNTYYAPRRRAITDTSAFAGAIAAGLWWGASSWILFYQGFRRRRGTTALLDFEISVLVGILAGSVIGAAIGLILGEFWQRYHRRQRLARRNQNVTGPSA